MTLPKAILKKNLLMKLWEKYPRSWKLILNIGVFLKYKTLNLSKLPRKIKLSPHGVLYINPRENRGRALLISEGVTQQRVIQFWKQAVNLFDPTLVIDVGVNYGECIFSTEYPEKAKIYGIEANPYLLSYIEKSRRDHCNQSQINIIHAFASDRNLNQQSFYIDNNWSGTSSAVPLPNHRRAEKIAVSTVTLDSLFENEPLETHRLLFKIDVEGYEAFVLRGMKELFQSCSEQLGLVEFDSVYMRRAGVDLDDFLAELTLYFSVFIFDDKDQLVRMEEPFFAWMQKQLDQKDIHTDLILTTDENRLRVFSFCN
jgi:FkbM family methyltransferase